MRTGNQRADKYPPAGYVLDGETLCPSCIPMGEAWRAYALVADRYPVWLEVKQCERCGEMLPTVKPRRKPHALRMGR